MTEQNQTGEPAAEDLTGAQTGDAAGAADQTPAAEVDSQAQVEAFKRKAEDEAQKRQNLELEIERLRNQVVIQANSPQGQQVVKQDAFSRRGLADEDWLTVGQQREILAEHSANLVTAFQLQSFISQNNDFGEIVGTFSPNGFNIAQPLKDLIKDNSSLRGLDNLVSQNPSYAPIAYQMAKQHKELTDLRAKSGAFEEHQKALELANQTAPTSPASIGGGAEPQQSAIANLDPNSEGFSKLEQRVQMGEFG